MRTSMAELADLLPRDKTDYERVAKLREIDLTEKTEIIHDLLEWIQDINWPIARDIIDILSSYPIQIRDSVNKILQSSDYEWVDNCIYYLIDSLDDSELNYYKTNLERIAYNPTQFELENEVDRSAQEVLKRICK